MVDKRGEEVRAHDVIIVASLHSIYEERNARTQTHTKGAIIMGVLL